MAAITIRSLARLQHITNLLRTHGGVQIACSNSIVRKLNVAVQPQVFVEEPKRQEISPFLEAIREWQETASFLISTRTNDVQALENETALERAQMIDLLETLVDEQILDFRQGWGIISS